MQSKKILILLGHPAKERESLCEVLALSYQNAAQEAGHQVDLIKIANLEFDPILHEGYAREQSREPDIITAQEKMIWAEHIVIVYPLWQFMIPALLKGFLERALTKGFAYKFEGNAPIQTKKLTGKSVRIIQTMAMPPFMYRWLAGQHGAKALRDILKFCGLGPVRFTYLGLAEKIKAKRKAKYLETVKHLARNAS